MFIKNFVVVLAILLSLFSLITVEGASEARFDAFHPTWGAPSGGQMITIQGCRFRNYGSAVCMFGEWASTKAKIIDDKTIHCLTPNILDSMTIPLTGVQLPVKTLFRIQFPGKDNVFEETFNSTLNDFWFGPKINSITPTLSSVAGGATLTISGFGFNDTMMGTSAQVWFNEVAVAHSITSDTQIAVTIPAGDFNREARIDVTWGDHYSYHSSETVSYGPYITTLPCHIPINGSLPGSATIQFGGGFFNDFTGGVFVNFTREAGTGGEAVEPTTVTASVINNGAGISVDTPPMTTFTQSFQKDMYMVIFGSNNDDIAYRFTEGPGTSGEITMTMEPVVSSISPTQGHLGGGDLFTVHGCGFDQFLNTEIDVRVEGPMTSICTGAGIQTLSATEIVCKTPAPATPGSICGGSFTVDVAFNWNSGGAVTFPITGDNTWTYGPQFSTATTITRGKVFGGDNLVVTGSFLEFTAGVPFGNYECDWGANPTADTNATLSGANTLTCTSPAWNITSPPYRHEETVTWRFGTGDSNTDTACFLSPGTHTFLWFPVCTSIEPTFGWLAGGQGFTIHGAGFADDALNSNISDTVIQFDTTPGINTWEQAATNIQIPNGNQITGLTPINRYADRGGNRNFRSVGTVHIYLNATTNNDTVDLTCTPAADYLFGPTLLSISPEKGPIGPKGSTLPVVTVTGLAVDEWVGKDNLVRFGNILGTLGTTTGNNIATNPNYASPHFAGERPSDKSLSGTDVNVEVMFDASNRTSNSDHMVLWGPEISGIVETWGFTPSGGEVISVTGLNFNEWGTDVQCLVAGEAIPGTAVTDTTITCLAPAQDFGTNATVWVIFGQNCVGDPDYSRMLKAGQIYYQPRITQLNPTFGYTSGNQLLTISGEGFTNWNISTVVLLGDYEAVSTTSFGVMDSITVKTPFQGPAANYLDGRGQFGTDVEVAFQMNGNVNWRIWSTDTYHYGPICTGLTAATGRTNSVPAGETFTVNGAGFDDVLTFRQDSTWVQFGANNGTSDMNGVAEWVVNTPADSCGANPAVTLNFRLNNGNVEQITCGNMFYGPTLTSIATNCSASAIAWFEKEITLTGTLLDDASYFTALSNVSITVGSAAPVMPTMVTSTAIAFSAPSIAYGQTNQVVTVSWENGCTNIAGTTPLSLDYVATWTGISLTTGYIGGGDVLQVQGRGFDCFNFDQITLTFGAAGDANYTGVFADTTANFQVPSHAAVGVGVGSEALTLKFNHSQVPDQTGFSYFFGPIITSITPTQGKLMGDDAVTLVGLNLDDGFFAGPKDVKFTKTSSGAAETIFQDVDMSDGTTVTTKTPDYRDWGETFGVTVRFNTSTGVIYETPNPFQYLYQPIITGVSSTHVDTRGGEMFLISGRDWSDFTTGRCYWGNRIAPNDESITANALPCTTPPAPFGYTAATGVIFDVHIHSISNAWHWHPYVEMASSASIPSSGQAAFQLWGAGFCNYNHVKTTLGTSEAVQSDIWTNWEIGVQGGFVSAGSVSSTSTFCKEANDCDCFFKGTPDSTASINSVTFS